MIKTGQSLIDTLINIMPSLKNIITIEDDKDYVDPHAAESLFLIWKNGSKKSGDRTFKRPTTISLHEVENMKSEGLVKSIGEKIEITDKGEEVIKIMILGDDRSSFENTELIINYNQALGKVKNVKTAKKTKVASGWWDRFE